ncbi:MAG TPA: DUF4349 domain-containing protein [Candidatus Limnocylindria bacterium]|nr:DUF4349 domain-containing protein [Candidatus Limnocylindria bacterium]
MLARRSYSPALLILLISLVVLLAAACAAAPAMPQPAGEDGSNGQGRPAPEAPSEDGATADLENGVRDGALIVYTGRLRLEVAEIAPAVESATRLIVDLGGYVAGSEEFNTTSEQSASVTFRVPSERWAEAVGGLRGLAGRVLNESTESAEVTAEVIDLEARIANLRASEAALQEIMTRAGTIEDVLQVQRELSNVRGQIEQLTASRDHLRDRAAFGTLTVSFESPVVAASLAQEGWQLSAEVDRALADLIRISQALSSMVIWLAIVALPVLLPLALVVFIALRLRRRWAADNRPADPLRPSV